MIALGLVLDALSVIGLVVVVRWAAAALRARLGFVPPIGGGS